MRLANKADIASLMLLQQQGGFSEWSLTHFEQAIEQQQCYVLEDKQQLIAFSVMSLLFEQAELLNIVVASAYQQQGLGKSLFTQHSQLLKSLGATECLLEVAQSNSAAKALYQSLGFEQIDLRKNYYQLANGLNDHALIMRVDYD